MLFGVERGNDFEDEVYFKWWRVVTPRFSDADLIALNYKLFSLVTNYQF